MVRRAPRICWSERWLHLPPSSTSTVIDQMGPSPQPVNKCAMCNCIVQLCIIECKWNATEPTSIDAKPPVPVFKVQRAKCKSLVWKNTGQQKISLLSAPPLPWWQSSKAILKSRVSMTRDVFDAENSGNLATDCQWVTALGTCAHKICLQRQLRNPLNSLHLCLVQCWVWWSRWRPQLYNI